jgi:hypothetical protein
VSDVVQSSHRSAKNCPALPAASTLVRRLGYKVGYTNLYGVNRNASLFHWNPDFDQLRGQWFGEHHL